MSGQTDQSPPVSRAFMSRLREVLTARLPAGPGWVVWVDGVVEELAAVTPAQGIDRVDLNSLADRLAAHGFDADDTEVICQDVGDWLGLDDEGYPGSGDRILALVRPVEGVILSREEATLAAGLLGHALLVPMVTVSGLAPDDDWMAKQAEQAELVRKWRALASRLEVS